MTESFWTHYCDLTSVSLPVTKRHNGQNILLIQTRNTKRNILYRGPIDLPKIFDYDSPFFFL